MNAQAIIQAMAAKTGFEAISVNDVGVQLRILGRVQQARMREHLELLVDPINEYTFDKDKGWTADISKLYFQKRKGERSVFVWRFLFEAVEDAMPYQDIVNVIASSRSDSMPAGGGPLQEIPLGHVSAGRHAPRGGRGAAPMGKARVGPALNQGGGGGS
jgi:hypothetical protein